MIPLERDPSEKNPFSYLLLNWRDSNIKGKLSNGIPSDSLNFYIDTHNKWRGEYISLEWWFRICFFKLLVNIGLDSDPGGAQQFVSRWYHLCSDTHPYPPGWQSGKKNNKICSITYRISWHGCTISLPLRETIEESAKRRHLWQYWAKRGASRCPWA